MEKVNKRFFVSILFFLIFTSGTLIYAADLVIPTIKAPYPLNNAQWDNSGDYFAYEANGKVYIRDSLSLLLLDAYAKNSQSNLSAFYKNPEKIAYPVVSVLASGNTVTIQTASSRNSQASTKVLGDLPVGVRAATINKQQNSLAFIGNDGHAYIYDINSKTTVARMNVGPGADKIYFTKNNRVIFADSNKTAGLYSVSGQKVRTYTSSSVIKGLSLSPDEETLITIEESGNLNFYNTASGNQLGYIPNLGSKNIRDVKLSQDSRKFLITSQDNSLYVGALQDFLFAPNTVAPAIKQFAINYNALDPNTQKDAEITKFDYTEENQQIDEKSAEYITSTHEKALEKQNFDLDDEKKAYDPVIITKQPEQTVYPSTITSKDREVTFTDKTGGVEEKSARVQEFKQDNTYQPEARQQAQNTTVIVDKTKNQAENRQTGSTTSPAQSQAQSQTAGTTIVDARTPASTGSTVTTGGGSTAAAGAGTNGNLPSIIIINGRNSNSDDDNTTKADQSKSSNSKNTDNKKSDEKKSKSKDEPKKDEKESKLSEEDIKTLFKDGHGLLFNVGIFHINEPYVFGFSFSTGYKNYSLIKPFYFGLIAEPFIGFAGESFPYTYKFNGEKSKNPRLIGIRGYIPLGFCIYPLKNSFELYTEFGFGASYTAMWNGYYPPNAYFSKFYPSYYMNVKVGVAWDFINFNITGSYEPMWGFDLGIDLGVIINLGGSRKIGSITYK